MTRARTGHPAATLMHHRVGLHVPAEKRALLRQARQGGNVLSAVGEAEHRGGDAER